MVPESLQNLFRPAGFSRDGIGSILIIRMNKVGDMICTLPLIRTARKEFPDARITVLAEDTNAGVIENEPSIDRVLVFRKGTGIYRNKSVNLARTLRGMSFDLAIGVKGGFSSFLAAAALLSGARFRVGYVSSKGRCMDLLYNFPVQPVDFSACHQIDACLNLLKAVGIQEGTKDISIKVPADSIEAAHNFLKGRDLKPKDRIVVFNISNNREKSSWKADNFVELGRLLVKEYHCSCIVTGMPSHEGRALHVCKEIGPDASFYKTGRLMDFAAITTAGRLLVTGDGGASHIGAAVETPVVALFGETSPVIWKPYGDRHIVLKASNGDVNSIPARDVLHAIRSGGLLQGEGSIPDPNQPAG